MKQLHSALGWLFPAASILLGLLLMLAAFSVSVSGIFRKLVDGAMAFVVGAFLAALGVLYFIVKFKTRADAERIPLVGKEGASVTVGAIEDFVRRIAAEVAAITDIQPRVVASGQDIRILISAALKQPAHIPDLAQSVSEKVRVALQTDLGIEKVQAVELNVTRILATQPTTKP